MSDRIDPMAGWALIDDGRVTTPPSLESRVMQPRAGHNSAIFINANGFAPCNPAITWSRDSHGLVADNAIVGCFIGHVYVYHHTFSVPFPDGSVFYKLGVTTDALAAGSSVTAELSRTPVAGGTATVIGQVTRAGAVGGAGQATCILFAGTGCVGGTGHTIEQLTVQNTNYIYSVSLGFVFSTGSGGGGGEVIRAYNVEIDLVVPSSNT